MVSFLYKGYCPHKKIPGASVVEADKIFAGYPRGEHHALKGLSFSIQPGERIAVVGPNGSGKSTLLKTIANLISIKKGALKIFGSSVGKCRHHIAYLPQRGEIDWEFPMSVRAFTLTGRYIHLGWFKKPGSEDKLQTQKALKLLKLDDLAERQIGQLSGGQQQRALFARTLVQDAPLILLDEPMNAIDEDTRQIIDQALETLKEEGKTVIMATHEIEHLSSKFDNVITLLNGQQI